MQIENIKFDGSKGLWKKQHQKTTAKALCRHFQHSLQRVIDYDNDNVEYFNVCDKCGKILSDEDVERINIAFEKFNKLKK